MRIVCCLAIGTIVSVLVAWGACIWAPRTTSAAIPPTGPVLDLEPVAVTEWPYPVPPDWPDAVGGMRFNGTWITTWVIGNSNMNDRTLPPVIATVMYLEGG